MKTNPKTNPTHHLHLCSGSGFNITSMRLSPDGDPEITRCEPPVQRMNTASAGMDNISEIIAWIDPD